MRVAAIDVGTNTTRLLVAEVGRSGEFRDLDRRLIFTRLGEGVDAKGNLAEAAIRRTIGAIAEFSAACGEFEVERVRVAATSAVRDAMNRQEFLDAARVLTGSEPEVLSGEAEAQLSFLGAAKQLEPDLYLVCDIGGGSTEFVLGSLDDLDHLQSISLDIGSVRMTERYIRSDPPEEDELARMEAAIDNALNEAARAIPRASEASLIGVAGTVTTLAAVQLGLRIYDPDKTHLFRLSDQQVRRMYRRLALMTLDERRKLSGIPAGRADVIVAGSAILVRSMAKWSFGEVTVSEKDILDGLVIEMLGNLV